MYKKELAIYSIYSLLLGLYAVSIRLFFYGLETTDVLTNQQTFNLSGLILIIAIAITFNIILIKGINEIKNEHSIQNKL